MTSKEIPQSDMLGADAAERQYDGRDAARVIGADYDTFHGTDGICSVGKNHQYIDPFQKGELERRAANCAAR